VYAFYGVVISFIDADWVLREYIFDLIPLDDDHKGRTVGKLILKRLKKQKIAGKLCKFFLELLRNPYVPFVSV
jgi:hypothetical protein